MTTQYVAVCQTAYDIKVYLINEEDEAARFVDDVQEHDEDIQVQLFKLTPITRKQALSDLIGV